MIPVGVLQSLIASKKIASSGSQKRMSSHAVQNHWILFLEFIQFRRFPKFKLILSFCRQGSGYIS